MKRNSIFRRLLFGSILLAIAAAMFFFGPWKTKGAPQVPTGEVRLDEFVDYVQARGEVRARNSAFVTAPYNAGTLQILKIVKDGTIVKKGDEVVEFDPSTLQRAVDQNLNTVKQLDAQIARLKAQQLIKDEQSVTDRMMAEFAVARARLDASRGEVVAAVENEKSQMALGKAEMRLKEVAQQVASNQVGAEADLAGILRRRAKANLDLELAKKNMAALKLFSPVDGLIIIQPNYSARTSILGGGAVPVFKEGDRAYAGAGIAELPDLSTIEVRVPVDEADRGKLEPGQDVMMRVDALPDVELKGKVETISTIARVDTSSYPPKKNFDMVVSLERPDPRLRPGMSATVRIAVLRLPQSILIPAEAIFEKGTRNLVYVLSGDRFEERSIGVARRGEGQVLVAHGLKPGERIALKDPTLDQGRD